jgi:DNA-binding transcriptional LysR family regulator
MDLNRIDLNLLVAFDVLMAERSVTRAAARLMIGQSAMSSTLGRLRKLFNDPLLVRDGRILVATPLAESLEGPIRSILTQLTTLLSPARPFDPATDQRTFTVLASDYVTVTFLHPLLARLESEAPHVRLRVRPVGEGFEEELRRNDVDLAIMPKELFPATERYRNEVLFQDIWVCAADTNHPDIKSRITRRQLESLPYLATASGSAPSFAERQMDLLGIVRQVEITADFGIAPFLLSGTRLVTVIPQRLGQWVENTAGIRLMEAPFRLAPMTEKLLWTERNEDDLGHRWLRQFMLDLARDFADTALPPLDAEAIS